MSIVFDALGWLDAILLLVAYVLVSSKRVEGSAVSYQLLNIIGSVLLLSNNVPVEVRQSRLVVAIREGT